jgi:hypothetical protein
MFGVGPCPTCARPRWGICAHCMRTGGTAAAAASTIAHTTQTPDPPPDPDDWSTMTAAKRNADRLLNDAIIDQEEWRNSRPTSSSNSR